jgi:hypothetical protein
MELRFEALYWNYCECQDACACEEDEEHVKRRWEGEAIEPPEQGIHVEDCDDATCTGCWLFEIDGPMPLFWWMVEHLGAQGGAVVDDGEVVDAWSVLQ